MTQTTRTILKGASSPMCASSTAGEKKKFNFSRRLVQYYSAYISISDISLLTACFLHVGVF